MLVVVTKKPEDVLAETIRSAMGRRNLSRTDLAERMGNLGYPKWSRQTVTEVTEGRRRILAAELYPLSFALETPLPALVMPWTEAGPAEIELPSGVRLRYFVETRAKRSYGGLWDGNAPKIGPGDTFSESYSLGDLARDHHSERKAAEAPSIVAAVVTSPLGVLVGRRVDGKPPWTFIAGEQDAVQDESPADTAVREVKEETGLRIVPGDVIGERDHPKTGRHMVYVAAKPALRAGLDVDVEDTEELAEVRWVDLAELDDLMGAANIYGPVHEFLERELGAAEG